MQMSSYFKANRDYQRLKEAQDQGKDEEVIKRMAFGEQQVINFPENVNIQEFTDYMLYPTLTYQDSYPKVKVSEKNRVKRLLGRLCVIATGLVSYLAS